MLRCTSRFLLLAFGWSVIATVATAAPRRAAEPITSCQSTATGDLRLHQLESRIFGNKRSIRVLLPPDYDVPDNRSRRYPVLYLLDGQNLFDACLSELSHREWRVDETVYELIAAKVLPPLIVVGIDHAGSDRPREYLPYKDFVGNPAMPEPAGKRFPDFLTDEVLPLVDGQYRTLPGHSNTGIGGSSYGGAAALYAILAKPNVFGYALIESPTLWVGMGQLVRDTSPLIAAPVKVFVGFGGHEADDPKINDKMTSLIRLVETNFRSAGYNESNFKVVVDPDAAHNEDAWAKRLPGALEFLFGSWRESPPRP